MKLFSFTTVKDEADIIESFVRYNLNILDGMVISDNCSNDNTYDILLKLKEEGLNIYLLKDEDAYFDQTEKRQYLMDYTFKEFNPDIVFPLDADEFIAAYDNVNPRKIIETLDLNQLHKYRFENYVISKSDNEKELFIPKRMKTRRILKDNKGCGIKTIIPRSVYDSGISLQMGAHNIKSITSGEIITSCFNTELFLAHYPVRSNYQLTNKIVIGRLNHSSIHDRSEGLGFHQYEIFDLIIKNGKIPENELLKVSKYYGVAPGIKNFKCSVIPLNTSFCRNITIKYSIKLNNDLLLANIIRASELIINHMREKNRLLECELNDLNICINKMVNSKSWKLTKPLRNIKMIIKR